MPSPPSGLRFGVMKAARSAFALFAGALCRAGPTVNRRRGIVSSGEQPRRPSYNPLLYATPASGVAVVLLPAKAEARIAGVDNAFTVPTLCATLLAGRQQ